MFSDYLYETNHRKNNELFKHPLFGGIVREIIKGDEVGYYDDEEPEDEEKNFFKLYEDKGKTEPLGIYNDKTKKTVTFNDFEKEKKYIKMKKDLEEQEDVNKIIIEADVGEQMAKPEEEAVKKIIETKLPFEVIPTEEQFNQKDFYIKRFKRNELIPAELKTSNYLAGAYLDISVGKILNDDGDISDKFNIFVAYPFGFADNNLETYIPEKMLFNINEDTEVFGRNGKKVPYRQFLEQVKDIKNEYNNIEEKITDEIQDTLDDINNHISEYDIKNKELKQKLKNTDDDEKKEKYRNKIKLNAKDAERLRKQFIKLEESDIKGEINNLQEKYKEDFLDNYIRGRNPKKSNAEIEQFKTLRRPYEWDIFYNGLQIKKKKNGGYVKQVRIPSEAFTGFKWDKEKNKFITIPNNNTLMNTADENMEAIKGKTIRPKMYNTQMNALRFNKINEITQTPKKIHKFIKREENPKIRKELKNKYKKSSYQKEFNYLDTEQDPNNTIEI